eukprot:TRINITY_DN1247_c1_g2_i1.p1 TRINITY_DN1247_c1_g2~~TRINITY_DN1247_c1_g2_i1.p1  ORF type:complete len:168 (-),score=60.91 TRINITY_DN1247_c1_g2_i1:169-672(-)
MDCRMRSILLLAMLFSSGAALLHSQPEDYVGLGAGYQEEEAEADVEYQKAYDQAADKVGETDVVAGVDDKQVPANQVPADAENDATPSPPESPDNANHVVVAADVDGDEDEDQDQDKDVQEALVREIDDDDSDDDQEVKELLTEVPRGFKDFVDEDEANEDSIIAGI